MSGGIHHSSPERGRWLVGLSLVILLALCLYVCSFHDKKLEEEKGGGVEFDLTLLSERSFWLHPAVGEGGLAAGKVAWLPPRGRWTRVCSQTDRRPRTWHVSWKLSQRDGHCFFTHVPHAQSRSRVGPGVFGSVTWDAGGVVSRALYVSLFHPDP